MNLLTQNTKLKKTSKINNARIFNFSIPAYKSKTGKIICPFAKECVKYCYAQKGNYTRFPIVQQLMEKKYQLTKQPEFINLMNKEISKKRCTHVRIHDSGDFYSIKYLLKWLQIAKDNTNVIFYAYTKSISFFKVSLKKLKIKLPNNFKVIFSFGSKQDNLINTKTDRHALIFDNIKELINKSYINASDNDLNAITKNKNVGLVYH
jgi:hypothetical protein